MCSVQTQQWWHCPRGGTRTISDLSPCSRGNFWTPASVSSIMFANNEMTSWEILIASCSLLFPVGIISNLVFPNDCTFLKKNNCVEDNVPLASVVILKKIVSFSMWSLWCQWASLRMVRCLLKALLQDSPVQLYTDDINLVWAFIYFFNPQSQKLLQKCFPCPLRVVAVW